MSDRPSWQSQSMKKSGGALSAGSMHAKLSPVNQGGLHAKIGKPNPLRLADGGDVSEAEDKAAGLKASEGESVGFFERLRMGNIDDPKSEAYKRFGAGRAKADREMDEAIKSFDDLPSVSGKEESPAKAESSSGNGAWLGATEDMAPAAPKAAPRRAPSGSTIRASAGKPAAPASASLSQRLGKEFSELERAATSAEAMPDASAESKRMVRKLADEKRKAYEAAADAEKTGKSVVFKR